MVVNDEYGLYWRLREVHVLSAVVSSIREKRLVDKGETRIQVGRWLPAHLDKGLFLCRQGVSIPNGRIPRYHILRDISPLQAIRLSDQPALLALAAYDQDWLIRI